ncbi:WD40 repeat-containing protein [Histoplasma capsulatum var. duboisii H88]|uniref:WD domain-containing protein n=2 Tax=Ajellomyces capsulatus TaxID=5037 RepID=F0UBM8_AJEC8|nr:WD40 domain-containing protein [Histoplasma capsulatum H143]EGC43084.1 WD40 repeat-containing protein [Histoplasma capsulatum var. duboisii H88]QSS49268.1 WD domain-containing protein [Histoplasma capsulatum var. duboisii H88]
MPTAPSRRMVPKDRFGQLFGSLKIQSYYDPAARGPGSHTIRTLAWNPTGSLIATGSVDRTLRIWNPERTHVKYSTELRGHSSGIEKVTFNPVKESELASCSSDGTVRFWDVRSKTCISRVDVGGEAFTMAWTADGSVILVGRKDDTLIPISVESPSTPALQTPSGTTAPTNIFKALTPHPQPVQTNATAFSHSLNTSDLDLFLTTGDGTVKVVSYPSFNLLHTIHAHTSACLSIALSPTSRYLAVGGSDALISLWDTTDWICKRTVSSANGGAVRGVSWSWDGRFIVGACDEPGCGGSGLEIFHAETGESVYTIPTGGLGSAAGANGVVGIGSGPGTSVGVPAVAWHPSRYWLAYSVTADGMGSSGGGLRIVGAGSGSL